MSAQTPRLVAGRYELGQRLGAGGMAEVFLARDRATGQDVALKLLAPGLTNDPKVVERFAAEAEAAAAIDHPNVVAVRDWGPEYIAMEYVPGPNLKELLRERGPLPEAEALALAAQIAAGLEAAHARGVVHLDVKPHNVLLAPGGEAKVADFGIARALGGTGATLTTVIGSAPYISPEQARGSRVDARSDVYSLGALLYELLTGRPPFEGEAPLQVAMRHLNEVPRPPRQLRPELSAGAEALVLRALAKEPAARFVSAADMGSAIEHARLGISADPALAATQPLHPLDATRPLAPPPLGEAVPSSRSSLGGRTRSGVRGIWPVVALVALLAAALLAFVLLRPSTTAPTTTPRPTATAPAATRPATTGAMPTATVRPLATATARPAAPTATTPPQPTATTRPQPTATAVPPTPTVLPTATIAPSPTPAPAVKAPAVRDERKPGRGKPNRDDDD